MNTHTGRAIVAAVVSAFVLARGAAAGPMTAAPATPQAIELPAAIALALDHHPALRAAAEEVAATEADLRQAGRRPNPELAWLREGHRAGNRTTTLQLNQPIELGGKRAARVAVAEGALAVAGGEQQDRRQAVRADVIAAYYAALGARERRQLAQATFELAGRGLDAVARRVAAGKVSPIDADKARLAQADARLEQARAEGDLAVALARLQALTGQAVAPKDDTAPLPDPGPLPAVQGAATDGPAVRQARRQLALQQAHARLARANRLPDVTLTVGSQRDDQLAGRQAVLGVAVPLPLFDRNSGNVAAAQARTRQAEAGLQAAELAARAETTAAWLRYRQARDEAQALEHDVVAVARSVYESTLRGFEFGKFSYLDVLDAQRTWFGARARHLQATQDAWQAHAALQRLAPTEESRP